MNKLSIAVLVAGTAAVTGYIVSKVMKNKTKTSNQDLFDDEYNDCCCDSCACEEDLDVVIPDEDSEDCTEEPKDASEDSASKTDECAEKNESSEDDEAKN